MDSWYVPENTRLHGLHITRLTPWKNSNFRLASLFRLISRRLVNEQGGLVVQSFQGPGGPFFFWYELVGLHCFRFDDSGVLVRS